MGDIVGLLPRRNVHRHAIVGFVFCHLNEGVGHFRTPVGKQQTQILKKLYQSAKYIISLFHIYLY